MLTALTKRAGLYGAAVPAPAATAEQPAVHALFIEHAPFVYRVLRRLGVSEAEVEDVCQEVFMVVHRRLPEFEGRSRLRTWIYAIAVRRASNHVRRAYRRLEKPTDSPPEPPALDDPSTLLEQRRARALLDALLDRLEQDKRQVFVLFELEELNMREIAAIVGCPLPTAYARLYAARRDLQRIAREGGVLP
jgi:RNA polymerase sigma-70 factor (ECF subfamily)